MEIKERDAQEFSQIWFELKKEFPSFSRGTES